MNPSEHIEAWQKVQDRKREKERKSNATPSLPKKRTCHFSSRTSRADGMGARGVGRFDTTLREERDYDT